jgi:hypothetical protein
VTAPDPGRILRRALLAWGLGHLALGRAGRGRALLAAEAVALGMVAWLTIGLADSSAYLLPYLAGMAFIVAWGWQAVDAYHAALRIQPERASTPARSPAAAIGWLSLPLLVWGAGFWLVAGTSASAAAVLDRFVTAWTSDALDATWAPDVRRDARAAAAALGTGEDRFRDVRFRLVEADERRATAVGEAIHFERRPSRFLGVFSGTELVPVADRRVVTLELEAQPVELPGAGAVGAVVWELTDASAP